MGLNNNYLLFDCQEVYIIYDSNGGLNDQYFFISNLNNFLSHNGTRLFKCEFFSCKKLKLFLFFPEKTH